MADPGTGHRRDQPAVRTRPVVLRMDGGVTNLVTAAASELEGACRVETSIRFDLKDRTGADSIEFMDRLGLDYEVVENNERSLTMPLSDARTVQVGSFPTRVARLDTPEQFTLPLALGMETAITRIGFSANSATTSLLVLKRTGFFRWGPGTPLDP